MNEAQLIVSKCQICNTGHFAPAKCDASGWAWSRRLKQQHTAQQLVLDTDPDTQLCEGKYISPY